MARLDYFAPGVYVEEIDRGSRPIEGIQTNIAGFVGFTEDVRGEAEVGKPMLVTSWSQYLEYLLNKGLMAIRTSMLTCPLPSTAGS
jgi:phage tail sheath protein FI